MINTLNNLMFSLENAVDMVDKSLLLPSEEISSLDALSEAKTGLDFSQNTSLIDKCTSIEEQYCDSKPVLRIIHHFACSGGSLITKCLSAMPNTFILSEVHPHSYRHLREGMATFLPSDIATLAKQAGFPDSEKLAKNIFRSSIIEANNHVSNRGGVLLLRDHSHSDYCVGYPYAERSSVNELLKFEFDIVSLVTVRNPVDCYASLQSNYWLHFEPQTFDEYCNRMLIFLSQFQKKQIITYESFIKTPDKVMKKICMQLQIEYNHLYKEIFDQFKVTGDSGRTGETIALRPRQKIAAELTNEIRRSKNFALLCKKYRFSSVI